ncbi:hypothetical protein [Micromonospora sp. CPCC 205561]|uniref:hypothetical protein n=1 Tax=Micromonospora sp. CPCC 205561 TaxID=3122407 RepID=UPI002FEEE69A
MTATGVAMISQPTRCDTTYREAPAGGAPPACDCGGAVVGWCGPCGRAVCARCSATRAPRQCVTCTDAALEAAGAAQHGQLAGLSTIADPVERLLRAARVVYRPSGRAAPEPAPVGPPDDAVTRRWRQRYSDLHRACPELVTGTPDEYRDPVATLRSFRGPDPVPWDSALVGRWFARRMAAAGAGPTGTLELGRMGFSPLRGRIAVTTRRMPAWVLANGATYREPAREDPRFGWRGGTTDTAYVLGDGRVLRVGRRRSLGKRTGGMLRPVAWNVATEPCGLNLKALAELGVLLESG